MIWYIRTLTTHKFSQCRPNVSISSKQEIESAGTILSFLSWSFLSGLPYGPANAARSGYSSENVIVSYSQNWRFILSFSMWCCWTMLRGLMLHRANSEIRNNSRSSDVLKGMTKWHKILITWIKQNYSVHILSLDMSLSLRNNDAIFRIEKGGTEEKHQIS